jgi:hypothetical protein
MAVGTNVKNDGGTTLQAIIFNSANDGNRQTERL